MKSLKYTFGLFLLSILPQQVKAQLSIDFESEDNKGYTHLGVYDSWENSPLRTGALKGNVKVVANRLQDSSLKAVNASKRILAFQRSRWGSNTYGARIDLVHPFPLNSVPRYVHVNIFKEKAGRVLLIGLGKRDDRPSQSCDVEQFSVLSSNIVTPSKWQDAVFPIKGAGGIKIYSLVVVPDCESPHNLSNDFAVYFDNIVLNDNPSPSIKYGVYPLNFDKQATTSHVSRYTSALQFKSPTDGEQTILVSQKDDKRIYQDRLSDCIKAKAGETLVPHLDCNFNSWMHSYVYIDFNDNGRFDCPVEGETETNEEGNELVSYSFYQSHDSKGKTTAQDKSLQVPSFTLPKNLKSGFYRLRYKVDWNSIDPAGNMVGNNSIKANGGVVVDTRINIHDDRVRIYRGQNAEGTNGELENVDGTAFLSQEVPFGKDFTFRVKPSPGFKFSHVVIRHGYRLEGERIINETPQYEEITVSATQFVNGTYTIPGKYIDGEVCITPYFPEK